MKKQLGTVLDPISSSVDVLCHLVKCTISFVFSKVHGGKLRIGLKVQPGQVDPRNAFWMLLLGKLQQPSQIQAGKIYFYTCFLLLHPYFVLLWSLNTELLGSTAQLFSHNVLTPCCRWYVEVLWCIKNEVQILWRIIIVVALASEVGKVGGRIADFMTQLLNFYYSTSSTQRNPPLPFWMFFYTLWKWLLIPIQLLEYQIFKWGRLYLIL